jgi:hypothetical protein
MISTYGTFAAEAAPWLVGLALAVSGAGAAGAQQGNHAHHHEHQTEAETSPEVDARTLSRITIVTPVEGAKLSSNIAVEFETAADLSKMTMAAHGVSTHLHVDIDGTSLMPSMSQLTRVGKQRYRYVFDLPVGPGKHVISVYWSDARHRTIQSTVQRREVVVVGEQ